MQDCIFCKIVAGDTNTKFIYEDAQMVVFPDIHPKAKTHLLLTSKKHINSLMHITEEDHHLLGHMLSTLPEIAHSLGLHGFRTVINTGREGGQEIDHFHIHMLSGNLKAF